jgi:hypothetical protein
MPRDYEQAVTVLYSGGMGRRFGSGPAESRAWVRGWPAEGTYRQPPAGPVSCVGPASHASGPAPLWFRIGPADR